MRKIYILGLVVILLDQASKLAVDFWMNHGQTIPIIQGIFHITYVQNRGAAFGILAGQRLFFILVTFAVVVLLLVYARQIKDNPLLQTAFGLQIGGAIGNLIDRMWHMYVIDFLDFRIWPVFNIADIAIVTGVALFALDVLLEWKQTRHEA